MVGWLFLTVAMVKRVLLRQRKGGFNVDQVVLSNIKGFPLFHRGGQKLCSVIRSGEETVKKSWKRMVTTRDTMIEV